MTCSDLLSPDFPPTPCSFVCACACQSFKSKHYIRIHVSSSFPATQAAFTTSAVRNAPLRVGINGFGRIGRLVLRAAQNHPEIEVCLFKWLITTFYASYFSF